jgi:hypothetical protein
MKAVIKMILVGLAFATSTANASIIGQFNVIETDNPSHGSGETFSGTGAAILDDSGVLTANMHVVNSSGSFFVDTTQELQFLGNWDGETFNVLGGSVDIFTCTTNANVCSENLPTGPRYDNFSGQLNQSGGIIINFGLIPGSPDLKTLFATYTFTPTTVPTPAAAWLFGSGLVGLIGITRKKKN